jgi:hypothetical protein
MILLGNLLLLGGVAQLVIFGVLRQFGKRYCRGKCRRVCDFVRLDEKEGTSWESTGSFLCASL